MPSVKKPAKDKDAAKTASKNARTATKSAKAARPAAKPAAKPAARPGRPRKAAKPEAVQDKKVSVSKVEQPEVENIPLDENGDEQISVRHLALKRKAELPDEVHPLIEKSKMLYMHRRVPVLIGAAVAIAIVVLVVVFASKTPENDGVRINDVFVQNETIDAIYKDAVKEGLPATPETRDRIKRLAVEEAFLASEAAKLNLASRPDVARRAEAAKARVYIAAMIEDYAAKHPATDEEVRAAYERDKALYGTKEYRVRHIAVSDEQTAREVIAKLKQKADFAKLVQEYSIDRDKAAGGLLNIRPGMLEDAQFAKAITSLKEGEYSAEPIETSTAWQVVRVEAVRNLPAFPDFELQKDALRKSLSLRNARAHFHELAKNAKVEEVR